MEYLAILIILSWIWVAFEMWKAPLLEQKPDGTWVTIKESKKIMNFFNKKNKKQ
jgi:hypothetical protein